jgi:hypothetical protein
MLRLAQATWMFLAVYINQFFQFSNWDDGSFSGWILVGFFLVAIKSVQRAWTAGNAPIQKAWIWLAILLLVLAFDKQIDIVSPVLNWFKGLSKEQGWYAYRRYIVFGGAGVALIAAIWLGYACRVLLLKHYWVTLFIFGGLLFETCVLFFRLATFHYVEPHTGFHFGCPHTNWLFEATGLALILFGCLPRVRHEGRPNVFEPRSRDTAVLQQQ